MLSMNDKFLTLLRPLCYVAAYARHKSRPYIMCVCLSCGFRPRLERCSAPEVERQKRKKKKKKKSRHRILYVYVIVSAHTSTMAAPLQVILRWIFKTQLSLLCVRIRCIEWSPRYIERDEMWIMDCYTCDARYATLGRNIIFASIILRTYTRVVLPTVFGLFNHNSTISLPTLGQGVTGVSSLNNQIFHHIEGFFLNNFSNSSFYFISFIIYTDVNVLFVL